MRHRERHRETCLKWQRECWKGYLNPNTVGWWAVRRHTLKQLLSGVMGLWVPGVDAECSFRKQLPYSVQQVRGGLGWTGSDVNVGTGVGPELGSVGV